MSKVRVLVVCMGNICRSPMAEGFLRARLAERGLGSLVIVDSAGTHAYHVGTAPDERARAATQRRGFDISRLRARVVADDDFERFDLILAMDEDNRAALLERAPRIHRAKIRLLMEYGPATPVQGVPDPYYGPVAGFERVLDMVEDAADGLIRELEKLTAAP